MKKLFFFAFLVCAMLVTAAPLKNVPTSVVLPNGKELACFASGDEFFNYLHDADGYAIAKKADGYFYYVYPSTDKNPNFSSYRFGETDPKTVDGLKAGMPISTATYEELREKSPYNMAQQSENGVYRSINQTTGMPVEGDITPLLYFVKISDDAPFTNSYSSVYNEANSTTSPSITSTFYENSYGKLRIKYYIPFGKNDKGVVNYYEDPMTREYLNTGNNPPVPESNWGDANLHREHALYRRCIEWANEHCPLPDSVDIDKNNDGIVDNICFVFSGQNEGWNDVLWPHAWAMYSTNVYINTSKGPKRIDSYYHTNSTGFTRGTCVHETFHNLGAPDFYRYSDIYPSGVAFGVWDEGLYPTWMRWKYQKWIPEIPEITESGVYTINSAEQETNNCYRIQSPYDPKTYFVVEYRRQVGDYEKNLPGTGLLVYRVDTRYSGAQNGPYRDELYVYRPGGTMGSEGNLRLAHYSKTVGRTKIDDSSSPIAFLQDGKYGGLDISEISEATKDDPTISFKVTIRSKTDSLRSVVSSATNVTLVNKTSLGALTYDAATKTFNAKPVDDGQLTESMSRTFRLQYLPDKYTFRIYSTVDPTFCIQAPVEAQEGDNLSLGFYEKLPNQLWEFVYASTNTYFIRNVGNPDLYIGTTVNADRPIVLRTRSTVNTMQWYMKPVVSTASVGVADGIFSGSYYRIKNVSTGKAMQPADDVTAMGKVIQQVPPTTAANSNQVWEVKLNKTGDAYIIKNRLTKYVLDINTYRVIGAQVFQSVDMSEFDFGQQWELKLLTNGKYSIKNRYSRFVLDNLSRTTDKSPVVQASDASSSKTNQQWEFELVEKVITDEEIVNIAPVEKVLFNTPNPATDQTAVSYILPATSKDVKLVIYNADGQQMDEITGLTGEEGTNEYIYNVSGLTPGVYFYTLTAKLPTEVFKASARMIVK